jgi:hypothetical protein
MMSRVLYLMAVQIGDDVLHSVGVVVMARGSHSIGALYFVMDGRCMKDRHNKHV